MLENCKNFEEECRRTKEKDYQYSVDDAKYLSDVLQEGLF